MFLTGSTGQVSSLDDVKTNSNIDNNATRSMALDHLGTIAAKMRAASLHRAEDDRLPMMPMSLEEVSRSRLSLWFE
jgi:hypothetical protein